MFVSYLLRGNVGIFAHPTMGAARKQVLRNKQSYSLKRFKEKLPQALIPGVGGNVLREQTQKAAKDIAFTASIHYFLR
ncbi:MAG: hypothetical protein AAF603_10090 [Pseudomonadota bacterium]